MPIGSKFRFTKVVFDAVEYIADLHINTKLVEGKYSDVTIEKDVAFSANYPEVKLDVFYMPQCDQNDNVCAHAHVTRSVTHATANPKSHVQNVARESKTEYATIKRPVILEIHGGGFTSGDKRNRRCLCLKLAKETNAAVFNVNYGVGENSPCPIPMRQLADAVNWIAANAEKYRLNLDKFVVTGDSAGAFYACFLAVLQDSEILQNLFQCRLNTRITSAVLNCGVYDMKLALNSKIPMKDGICKSLMGKNLRLAKESDYFAGLALTEFVTEKFPPTMLIYASNDLFCKGQGAHMLQKLHQAGVPVECVCAKSVFDNHCFSLFGITDMAKQADFLMLRYLRNHFEN